MASTNHTTNYDLSQFIANDKPAWLGDYNQDMNKIDAGMQANKVSNASNLTKIEELQNKVGSLETSSTDLSTSLSQLEQKEQNDVTNLQTNINQVENSLQQNIDTIETQMTTNTSDITKLKENIVVIESSITLGSAGIGSVQIPYPEGFNENNCVPISLLYKVSPLLLYWGNIVTEYETSAGSWPCLLCYIAHGGMTNPDPTKFAIQIEWPQNGVGKPSEGTVIPIKVALLKYE